MPFCAHCGNQEPEEAAFCSYCGQSMTVSPTSIKSNNVLQQNSGTYAKNDPATVVNMPNSSSHQESSNKIKEETSVTLARSKTALSSHGYQQSRWSYKFLIPPGRRPLVIKLALVVMITVGATVGALKVIPTFFHHTCNPKTFSTASADTTQVGTVKMFPVISQGWLEGITSGPDCNLWFVANGGGTDWNSKIGRITPDGTITRFSLPSDQNYIGSNYIGGIGSIISGPDGNLWFTEYNARTGGGGQIGRITPDGTITRFSLPSDLNSLDSIISGPDGNLWFTEGSIQTSGRGQIGRITPAGIITEFPLPSGSNSLDSIISGPDGNLWFTEGSESHMPPSGGQIGRTTPTGTITEFPLSATSEPYAITSGSDSNLWFLDANGSIGRITPAGIVAEFPIPGASSSGGGETNGPDTIISGPGGNLWFTEHGKDDIGRITPTGAITEFFLPHDSYPPEIIPGPDGNLWFAESNGNIGRITPAGTITEFPLPGVQDAILANLTLGSDGNLWFTENRTYSIGRIIP